MVLRDVSQHGSEASVLRGGSMAWFRWTVLSVLSEMRRDDAQSASVPASVVSTFTAKQPRQPSS